MTKTMRVAWIEEGEPGRRYEFAGKSIVCSALSELMLGHAGEPFVVMVHVGEEFFLRSLGKIIELSWFECFFP